MIRSTILQVQINHLVIAWVIDFNIDARKVEADRERVLCSKIIVLGLKNQVNVLRNDRI